MSHYRCLFNPKNALYLNTPVKLFDLLACFLSLATLLLTTPNLAPQHHRMVITIENTNISTSPSEAWLLSLSLVTYVMPS